MDFLIVGLGNPGNEYELTRHNIGFIVLDNFAIKAGIEISKSGYRGLYGKGEYLNNTLYLLKPQTFMNRSGESVKEIKNFYKIPSKQMIVIHDELDISLGNLKVKAGGGTAGHNGLESIKADIGKSDFTRVRVGIGKPDLKGKTVKHVLSSFHKEEIEILNETIKKATDAINEIISNGARSAMNKYNEQIN
ncbi:MAG: aminoacyl-tRNA hydrolase [Thermodesulfobacteriota bacterium]